MRYQQKNKRKLFTICGFLNKIRQTLRGLPESSPVIAVRLLNYLPERGQRMPQRIRPAFMRFISSSDSRPEVYLSFTQLVM